MFRTLKTQFPHVYVFRARSSMNVVIIATRLGPKADINTLRQRTQFLVQSKRITLPMFTQRIESLEPLDPPSAAASPVLTDDFAPVEGLSEAGGVQGASQK